MQPRNGMTDVIIIITIIANIYWVFLCQVLFLRALYLKSLIFLLDP